MGKIRIQIINFLIYYNLNKSCFHVNKKNHYLIRRINIKFFPCCFLQIFYFKLLTPPPPPSILAQFPLS